MASTVPEVYEGRLPALVKHALLKSYLEKLLRIIGMSARSVGRVEICYVDCFAGPWGSEDENLEGTSIALSLDTLAACKAELASLGVDARMRALYVEKDKTAFRRLSAFLAQGGAEVEHACKNGDFVDLRAEILQWCGSNAFAFFFVDPKGWTQIAIDVMRPLLERPRSEFLINFIYEFINRTASMAKLRAPILGLLGREVDVAGMTPAQREEALVKAYRASLEGCVPAGRAAYRARTAYVRVLHPERKRTKYHLIYLTSHPKGVVEFMEISQKIDIVQARVRSERHFDRREERSGMADMFGEADTAPETDGRSTPEEVDRFWRRYLAKGERLVDTAAFADILGSTDWFPSELQASLVRLIAQGEVVNVDAAGKRRPIKPLHYEKTGERLKLAD